MSNFLVKVSILACLASPLAAFSNTATYSSMMCDVPVCNIQETIDSLRNMNGDQRGMYALNMKEQYKNVTDAKALENLYQTGLEMKDLFAELKDEDWVQRAAADLINQMVFNLARYSEVDANKLIAYYHQFATQTFRYNLIAHWQNEILKIENIAVLENLVKFAEGARAHSIAVGDEDWVARAATSLISEITIKMTHLDPAHEGLYDVKLTAASLALDTLGFDRVAVLDSSSSKNLVVVFMNSKLRVIVYKYEHAEISGNKVSGLFMSNNDNSHKFNFTLDRATGKIEGAIESTRHDKIEFYGKQLFSTKSVFAGAAPHAITHKDIVGTMTGEMAGIKGKFTIKSFQDNVYSATFVSDNHSVIMNFQGKFFPKNAVLSFTSNDKIKLTLSYRDNGNGAGWKGTSFSTTTGTVTNASFSALK